MFDFLNTQSPVNPVTESDIADVEQEYGIRFPQFLRQYYPAHNGRSFDRIELLIRGRIYAVEKISGLKDPELSLEELLRIQRLQDYPVRQMIPFAEDPFGGLFYYHSGTGIVYYSDLENDDFTPVCKGIECFFRILDAAALAGRKSPYDITKYPGYSAPEADDFLPLGSVVELPDTSHRIMIINRAPRVTQGDEEYYFDYGGTAYPSGFDFQNIAYFNREDIIRVVFYGYQNSEEDALQTTLKRNMNTYPNINKGSQDLWNNQA